MITSSTFLCQLTERQQKEILATLKENLINEGFNEIEIQKMLNSAKENRLVDLEEYMNIEFFIEKYKTENNTMKDIRILIKEYRERNGYSIQELSELIGVSEELFQKFEEEEHALSDLDLIKLTAVFGRDFELEVNKALAKSKQYGDGHKNEKISLMNLFVPKASEQDNEEDELETEYDKQEIYYKKKYEELLAIIESARTKVEVIDERGTVCGFELEINEYGNIAIRKGTEITCYESDTDEWHDNNGDYKILKVKCNYK